MESFWENRLRRAAAAGGLVWLLASGAGIFADRATQLIALAPVVIVPLGLAQAAQPARGAGLPLSYRGAAAAVVMAGPCALLSLVLTPSAGAAGLAALWLVATLLVGLAGATRLLRRGVGPVSELAIDAGLLYLPVGGVWLLASRAGQPLLGFKEPIVTFTAAHFHFAGFAAPVVAGLLGRKLGAGAASRFYRVAAAVVLLGIPLVAAGIQFSRSIEMPAAVVLSAGMFACATLLVRTGLGDLLRGPARARVAGSLRVGAGLSLVFSMFLAALFTATGSATRGSSEPMIAYSEMAELHGVANALGFALLALLSFTVAPPPPPRPRGGTWPRLLGGRWIGPDFFERHHAVDPQREVQGQLGRLEDFAHAGFDAARVHPGVRDFYERTADYTMKVTPHWHAPFGLPARLFSRFASRWLGQLVLPTQAEDGDRVRVRLFGVRDEVDGRAGARGYVRTYQTPEGSEQALYVASYATHHDGERLHLSAAFPLPWSSLVGVLRLDDGDRAGGLVVTSRPRPGEPAGDEGMYLSTALGPVRLPLDERIAVWAAEDGRLQARHEVRLLGLRCFDFDYEIVSSRC